MKTLCLSLLILWPVFARQTQTVPAVAATTVLTANHRKGQSIPLTDFRKFYIGFMYRAQALDVITLTIRQVQQGDSTLKILYTINSRTSRHDGIGEIDMKKSLIHLENLKTGRILKPADGKLVFESIGQDSLNYWKLKEK